MIEWFTYAQVGIAVVAGLISLATRYRVCRRQRC